MIAVLFGNKKGAIFVRMNHSIIGSLKNEILSGSSSSYCTSRNWSGYCKRSAAINRDTRLPLIRPSSGWQPLRTTILSLIFHFHYVLFSVSNSNIMANFKCALVQLKQYDYK